MSVSYYHAVHSLIRKGTGVARIKRTSVHVMMQILCKQNMDKFICPVKHLVVIVSRI